jgi:hypothetical protein
MLTPFDEFPIHQTPYPFSVPSVTDLSFDDGFYFGVFSAEHEMFLFQGLRVNPNNDMVGGYAGIMMNGTQHTTRFKRPWRPQFETAVGPYRFEIIEPFREIHLLLEDNESDLSFDLRWLATAPVFEEAHHLAIHRDRRTTDQTRYTQSGTAEGFIDFRGERIEVSPGDWWGSRDHSWGIYYQRPPLAPSREFLRPRDQPAARRALRFWTVFSGPGLSGFWGLHEGEHGERGDLNDTFGTPFEGILAASPDSEPIELVSADHEANFDLDTARFRSAEIELTDRDGGVWHQHLEDVGTPWWPHTIGYGAGSWKDGGSMASYAGVEDLSFEWDSFDFSTQPFRHDAYDGRNINGGAPHAEHLARVTTTAPDGQVTVGAGQVEFFLDAPYEPYGVS